MTELRRSDASRKEVEAAVNSFFEAGKNGDMTALQRLHGPADRFTKFDDVPPYSRQGSDEAFVHEQAYFATVSDLRYDLADLKIDFVADAAVATFYLVTKGIMINDYSYEGRTVSNRSRVTMILARDDGGWKIFHEHLSLVPEWSSRAEERSSGGDPL
ncbi:MAG TPA: nuclear transport factor 2 family protein [Conexivisphaerales archaeon]|nr:nuclear transport factor 2 family protein [Conexivisphaerales archaeon]